VLTFGSLFAGIGGLDLGFERAGLRCRWQVEINPFARRVLERHWPAVARHDDVRTFPTGNPGDWRVDVIGGGFPCQDISTAGGGAGLDGDRSGLWAEYARIVRVLRPRFVVVENSPAITSRGLGRVLGDLAGSGYDAEWDCLPAAAFGAPHLRQRTFVIAYPMRERRGDADCGPQVFTQEEGSNLPQPANGSRWAAEPGVSRVADGVPSGVDRLRGTGNAISPVVAEWIGRRLLGIADAM
jgi:DNA (cytosine-5)-methyltransferase 1